MADQCYASAQSTVEVPLRRGFLFLFCFVLFCLFVFFFVSGFLSSLHCHNNLTCIFTFKYLSFVYFTIKTYSDSHYSTYFAPRIVCIFWYCFFSHHLSLRFVMRVSKLIKRHTTFMRSLANAGSAPGFKFDIRYLDSCSWIVFVLSTVSSVTYMYWKHKNNKGFGDHHFKLHILSRVLSTWSLNSSNDRAKAFNNEEENEGLMMMIIMTMMMMMMMMTTTTGEMMTVHIW